VAPFSGPLDAKALRFVGPALTIMLAVGCGSAQRPTTVRPASRPADRPSVGTPAQRPTWTVVPRAKREKFLAALKAIDRPLAADEDAALTHAVDICFRFYDRASDEALRTYTRMEYGSGTASISPAAARKIVTATKKWICPAGGLYRRWES
jgi:hypothetical protein